MASPVSRELQSTLQLPPIVLSGTVDDESTAPSNGDARRLTGFGDSRRLSPAGTTIRVQSKPPSPVPPDHPASNAVGEGQPQGPAGVPQVVTAATTAIPRLSVSSSTSSTAASPRPLASTGPGAAAVPPPMAAGAKAEKGGTEKLSLWKNRKMQLHAFDKDVCALGRW